MAVGLEEKQMYFRHVLELKLTGFTDRLDMRVKRQGKSKNGLNSTAV